MNKKLSIEHKNLIRRYLIWAYKSTKESFERIERKTTQLLVDEYILERLAKNKAVIPAEFRKYIAEKRRDELKLKHQGKQLRPEYAYLKDRLEAVESAVKYFLGKGELKQMACAYEQEFIRRIWESRDH